jgi:hypothetical protein
MSLSPGNAEVGPSRLQTAPGGLPGQGLVPRMLKLHMELLGPYPAQPQAAVRVGDTPEGGQCAVPLNARACPPSGRPVREDVTYTSQDATGPPAWSVVITCLSPSLTTTGLLS